MVRTIRGAAVAAGACVLLVASCGRQTGHVVPTYPRPVGRGLTFTIRMVASSGTSVGGGPSRRDSIATQFLDGALRVDFPSSRDQSRPHRATPGFYLLVNTTAKTTTLVMPASMQYWEARFDSAAVRRAQSPTVIGDIEVSGGTLGSGGTVNGYTTERYRITTRYTETPLDASTRGGRKTVHLVEDVWVTRAFADVSDPMEAYLRVLPSSGTVGDLVEKHANARRKLFNGLPIRTMWAFTQTFDGGAKASRTVTIDILNLKRAGLDPAAFRVPDGYSRLDLAAQMNAIERLLKGGETSTKGSATGRKKP